MRFRMVFAQLSNFLNNGLMKFETLPISKSLITNGTLLGKTIGKKLLEAGIDDITISVDAAYP